MAPTPEGRKVIVLERALGCAAVVYTLQSLVLLAVHKRSERVQYDVEVIKDRLNRPPPDDRWTGGGYLAVVLWPQKYYANSFQIDSSGAMMTSAHGLGDVGTTCLLLARQCPDSTPLAWPAKISKIDLQHDVAMLIPDTNVSSPLSSIPPLRSPARVGAHVNIYSLRYCNFGAALTSASWKELRGFYPVLRGAQITTITDKGFALLDSFTGPGSPGSPVFDDTGALLGIVSGGREDETPSDMTMVSLIQPPNDPCGVSKGLPARSDNEATSSTDGAAVRPR